jgi:hypothetical protein
MAAVQCRQKTVEVKAKCTACTLYFCPRCLENRYKELVDEVRWGCGPYVIVGSGGGH